MDHETDRKMLWQSWYDEALDWGWSESTAIQYAQDKMADLESRAIEAAEEALRVF